MGHQLIKNIKGQVLIELLVAIGASVILVPAIFSGFAASREGSVQQSQRLYANSLAEGALEAIRVVREASWNNITTDGTYHVVPNGNTWSLISGPETIGDFTRSVVIGSVNRDATGQIVTSGGTVDPATKKITATVSWGGTIPSSVRSVMYLTSFANHPYIQTTAADFNAGVLVQTQVTNGAGGEVKLINNNKAKWCSPEFSVATIDLPDGPPVAVSARSSAVSANVPNDVFTAVSPSDGTSVKLAYLTVTANSDPPVPTLQGTFTLDPVKYSAPGLVPSGINLDNNFRTNDIKYYTSGSGALYALIATDKPDHEVVAVQITDGVNPTYQDAVNKIYKYKTFFNTRIYQGNNQSTPNQDQAPFGYGATAITTLGTKGYVVSGGFLYVFDLSNIDTKTPASGLDMVGCRIELDGYDCQPGNGTDEKYSAGQTGTTYGNTTGAAHLDCSDGGNIELHADNQISPVTVGGNTYIYVAVGAGTNPEFNIANVTTVPTNNTNPKISSSSCGTISSGNSAWKRSGSLDFNTAGNSEEAANSVYAAASGNRAYMTSNGGIDGNHDGKPDSHQFYIINTTSKTAPAFLSGTPATGATSGYYDGNATNIQLFPRRSLTVLNSGRAIVIGQDGVPNDGTDPFEYQVLNIENEANPIYCNGLNFSAGFNDLISVSEADLDNFVYMVANTNEKQLKIIQGGPDSGIYVDSGTIESQIFDAGVMSTFNSYLANETLPAGTSIKFQIAVTGGAGANCQTATYSYVGPDGTASSYFTNPSGPLPYSSSDPNFNFPGRCFRYKAFLSTIDTNQTPVLNDFTVNYSP